MNEDDPSRKGAFAPGDIQEMASAFQRCRVLLTAYELGIFTAIGDGGHPSAEVAKALGTDARATDRLMNALCALGLLEKAGDRFSNTPSATKFLVRGKPDFLAGLMHTVHLWNSWSTLTEAVRKGTTVLPRHVNDRGETWLQAFIGAMHARARAQAPALVAQLDLGGVSRVLDIGGGSGAFSMAFVRAKDGVRATVFDLPNVLPLTRDYIAQEKLSDRIETVEGDYNSETLGSGFDLVFLSAILHSNSPEENRTLIRKCSDALNPRGQVVVVDFIMDEDRMGPPFGTLFALNMLVGTKAGDTYTESEVQGWMKEAGLAGFERKETGFGTTLIVGRKA